MKVSKLLALAILLAIGAAAYPQNAQVANSDVVEQSLRKHIEYLASDKLEGRRTGEPGATLAAKYIAKQFSAIKLEPGYDSRKADLKRSKDLVFSS